MLLFFVILNIILFYSYFYFKNKYEQKQIEDWKKSLNLENLITDNSLRDAAKKSWDDVFNLLLDIYLDACDKLNITAIASFSNIKTILENNPNYLKSNLKLILQLENTHIKYTYIPQGIQKKIILNISQTDIEQPEYKEFDSQTKTYTRYSSWDY